MKKMQNRNLKMLKYSIITCPKQKLKIDSTPVATCISSIYAPKAPKNAEKSAKKFKKCKKT